MTRTAIVTPLLLALAGFKRDVDGLARGEIPAAAADPFDGRGAAR